jgi:hypothetical protein
MIELPTDVLHLLDRLEAKAEPGTFERVRSAFVTLFADAMTRLDDSTIFVATGDIPAMWIRDSTWQLRPLLAATGSTGESERIIAAVSRRQAKYLLIGLRLRESGKEETAADASFAYVRDYVRQFSEEKFMRLPEQADNLLKKPASDGPLSKWMFLAGELPQGESWEPAAGNLEGILEKNVRPVWRKTSDPRLSSTWDLLIEFQGALAGAGGSDFEREKFETLVKPRLLFGRAVDRISQGQPNLAANEMLALIKKYPTHPDWPSWAEKLRLRLGPASTASPAGE